MPTYVFRDGKVVEKTAETYRDAPYVISDEMPSTRHMADNKFYTSKHKFREATKAAGCIEVGNSPIPPHKRVPLSQAKRVEDIKRAIYDLKNGRRDPWS